MSDETRLWDYGRHADRRPLLIARNAIKEAIRRHLAADGFVEVETACLQVSPGNEAHLHAFETCYRTEGGQSAPFYLHTSPEFAMKKLLAAGEQRIFTFAPCFRNGEMSRLHTPEFAMLEWYRVGGSYYDLMADCAEFARIAAVVTGRAQWHFDGLSSDVSKPFATVSLEQAFAQYAKLDLAATIGDGGPDLDAMRSAAEQIGVRVASDDTWSDLFSRILTQHVEPHLGDDTLTMLIEYPLHEAALARPLAGRPRHAERFEMYACGVELANGFGELTDADEQRRRFEAEMAEKKRIYGRRYPIDEDFLAALSHMPPAAGCALGFDRLVMLATGAPDVASVQWAPVALPSARA